MIQIPDPLHPAVAHFPIALICLGTLLVFVTIFTQRGALPQFAALILILAAGSAQFAVITGDDQTDEIIQRMPESKPLIRSHAEWGERTRLVSVIAAISAVLALASYRLVRFRRALALITTFIAAGACYCAFETAENGGQMVYEHRVGVRIAPNAVGPAGSRLPGSESPTPTVSPGTSPAPKG